MAERRAPNPSPQPLPLKESLLKRYKVVWRVLLISNFALAAYMFAKARKKDMDTAKTKHAEKTKTSTTNSVPETPFIPPQVTEPLVVSEPIFEHQQPDLFKLIVEEKR